MVHKHAPTYDTLVDISEPALAPVQPRQSCSVLLAVMLQSITVTVSFLFPLIFSSSASYAALWHAQQPAARTADHSSLLNPSVLHRAGRPALHPPVPEHMFRGRTPGATVADAPDQEEQEQDAEGEAEVIGYSHAKHVPVRVPVSVPVDVQEDLQEKPESNAASKAIRTLAAVILFISTAIASNFMHIREAFAAAQQVFAGGSQSMLQMGIASYGLSEQQELLVNFFAGFIACSVSVTLTYPVDTIKTRLQAKDFKPTDKGICDLYKGLLPSLATICPSASLFVAMSFYLKRMVLALPFIDDSWSVFASVLSGAFCNAILSLYRVPSDMMIKLIQTDVCKTVPQAMQRIFCSRGAFEILFAVWSIILVKAIPYGALKLGVYEAYEILLGSALASWGLSKFAKSMICGACSGVTTGLITTPVDVVMTRLMTQVHDIANFENKDPDAPPVPLNGYSLLKEICTEIYEEKGIRGFFIGALFRASYYAPSSCSFFAVFETLRVVFSASIAESMAAG
uniref:ADP,ATP carrier protein n=1 Tax=Eutreptiella gymnastica TaxID=73025 RepID=A0A7S4GAT8_9EUGL